MKYQVLSENYTLSLIERLLTIRNLKGQEEKFFSPSFSELRNDPFLLNQMETAVQFIISAMQTHKKILIFGDYDVDGITSSRILYELLHHFFHYPQVDISYPSRQKEGYGLRTQHLDRMKEQGVQLVITVDNGITALKEAAYAKQLGIELIITDHHQPLAELPDALAVINPLCSPNYPFKALAGVGVAFKLVVALLSYANLSKREKNQIFRYFLPIVTIGTIADVMPLRDENRRIVKEGLKMMNHHKSELPPSLVGFLDFLNLKEQIDSYHISFQIAPRINAGGRIASPQESLEVFKQSGEAQKAFLERLEAINTQRKTLQEQMLTEAEQKLNHKEKVLIIAEESFHEGIIGLIAGRLTERYHKPSLVGKQDNDKGLVIASLR